MLLIAEAGADAAAGDGVTYISNYSRKDGLALVRLLRSDELVEEGVDLVEVAERGESWLKGKEE